MFGFRSSPNGSSDRFALNRNIITAIPRQKALRPERMLLSAVKYAKHKLLFWQNRHVGRLHHLHSRESNVRTLPRHWWRWNFNTISPRANVIINKKSAATIILPDDGDTTLECRFKVSATSSSKKTASPGDTLPFRVEL
jgi:hypothetical protein